MSASGNTVRLHRVLRVPAERLYRAFLDPDAMVSEIPLAQRQLVEIAKALSRWGHIVLPVALITIGALILIKGGAFAL